MSEGKHIADLTDDEIREAINHAQSDETANHLRDLLVHRQKGTELEQFDAAMQSARHAISGYREDVGECCVQVMLAIRAGDLDHACWIAMRVRDRALGVEGMLDDV